MSIFGKKSAVFPATFLICETFPDVRNGRPVAFIELNQRCLILLGEVVPTECTHLLLLSLTG